MVDAQRQVGAPGLQDTDDRTDLAGGLAHEDADQAPRPGVGGEHQLRPAVGLLIQLRVGQAPGGIDDRHPIGVGARPRQIEVEQCPLPIGQDPVGVVQLGDSGLVEGGRDRRGRRPPQVRGARQVLDRRDQGAEHLINHPGGEDRLHGIHVQHQPAMVLIDLEIHPDLRGLRQAVVDDAQVGAVVIGVLDDAQAAGEHHGHGHLRLALLVEHPLHGHARDARVGEVAEHPPL